MKNKKILLKKLNLDIIFIMSLFIIFILIFAKGTRFFIAEDANYLKKVYNKKENKKEEKLQYEKKKNNKSHFFDSLSDVNLNRSFAEDVGRTNPFVPVYPIDEAPRVPGQVRQPTGVAVPSFPMQPQILFPTQLPPLPDQKMPEKPPTIEVPSWPSHSPVLTAGPPERLSSMLKLRLTGILTENGGKKYAIIEETVANYNPVDKTTSTDIRSHVVKEGSIVTEYRVRVKSIGDNKVVLMRGNQKIDLYLKELPRTITAPPKILETTAEAPVVEVEKTIEAPPASKAK